MECTNATVLVVDDDAGVRAVAQEALGLAGYDVAVATCGAEVAEILDTTEIMGAIVDLVLPDCQGTQVLEQIRATCPDAIMIMATGYASLDSAMEAVRLGAYDYIRKPFSTHDLVQILQRGLHEQALARRNRELVEELDQANHELNAYRERLEAQVAITTEKLNAFIDLGRRLGTQGGAAANLSDILEAAMSVVGAHSGAVLVDGAEGLRCLVAHGEARRDLAATRFRLDEPAFADVLASGQVRVFGDLLASARNEFSSLTLLGFTSLIVAPIQHESAIVGLLALFDVEDTAFAANDTDLLPVLCAQAGSFVVRQRSYERDQELKRNAEFIGIVDLLS